MTKYLITGVGVYGYMLVLNPMMGQLEGCSQFGPYETKEELLAFYNGELVEPYTDEGPNMYEGSPTKKYHKSFRKGGPLEWYNVLMPGVSNSPGWHGHGIHEVLMHVENIVKGDQLYV